MLKLFLILLLIFNISCAKKDIKIIEIKMPNWISNPYSISTTKDRNEIAAIGIAEKIPNENLKIQIDRAKIEGKNDLVAQNLLQLTNLLNDLVKKSEISNKEEFIKSYVEILKKISKDINLEVIRTHIWQNISNDTVFVRVIAIKSDVISFFDKQLLSYSERTNDKDFIYITDKIREEIKKWIK